MKRAVASLMLISLPALGPGGTEVCEGGKCKQRW